MFFVTEITHRFQTARPEIRSLLLQCLLPWLENMELVAANVTPATPLSYIMVHIQLYLQHFTENQIAYFFFFLSLQCYSFSFIRIRVHAPKETDLDQPKPPK